MNRDILGKEINAHLIERLKNEPNDFISFLRDQNDGTIIFVLEKLGRLDNSYSREPLLSLLNHRNENIRVLAIKNLAKLEDLSLLNTFVKFAKNDISTAARRESVSAIGRLRKKEAITSLLTFLEDEDPKVVMQAIRGLLVFSYMKEIKHELSKLINHPNELIREVINKEIFGIYYRPNSSQKHDEFPLFMKNVVVNGDVLKIIRHIPAESIHLTFTSPPYYNARDYSIYKSYQDYLNFLEEVFKEVHRITKEGRFFILNTSPIIIPRISRAHASKRYPIPFDIHPLLVKMGWEFIDDIIWVKPEASVKNRNAGFLQHRKPLAYKPNSVTEMLMVYRKKTDKLIDWNIQQYGFEKLNRSKVVEKYETTNVWRIDPTFDKIHSAVFPLELCNRVIKYYSYVEDLVFDPFAGSGTLGRAAINLNRFYFLTEMEAKYIDRIKEEFGKSGYLFDQNSQPKYYIYEEFITKTEGS